MLLSGSGVYFRRWGKKKPLKLSKNVYQDFDKQIWLAEGINSKTVNKALLLFKNQSQKVDTVDSP